MCGAANRPDRGHSFVKSTHSPWPSPGPEPIISDTSSISWQIFKAPEPVEMINGHLRYSLRFGQPQVDRDAAPPLSVSFQRSPICHAATCGAEMKLERLAPDVGL